jgi:hypothetical protein
LVMTMIKMVNAIPCASGSGVLSKCGDGDSLVRLAKAQIIYPTQTPQTMPTIAARGMEVAGSPRETPPTNTTASMPSRRTVIKGKTNKAHFPALVRLSTAIVSTI